MNYKLIPSGNLIKLLIMFFLLFNCSKDSVNELPSQNSEFIEENQRMIFLTYEEFNKTVIELSALSNEELNLWIQNNNKNSLYDYFTRDSNLTDVSDYLKDLPDAYKAIFNNAREIIISDKVIWLNEEKLYEFHLSDDIESSKSKINELKEIGYIKLSLSDINDVTEDNDDMLNSRTSIGQNVLEARYQYEFNAYNYYNCSGGYTTMNAKLKYVHELMTVQSSYGNVGDSKLYLRVKLEWKGSSWKPAGEPRNITLALNFTGTYLTFPNGVIIPTYGSNTLNVSYSCSGDRTILLKSSDSYDKTITPYWSVQSTSTIQHQLQGGFYAWTNYFNY